MKTIFCRAKAAKRALSIAVLASASVGVLGSPQAQAQGVNPQAVDAFKRQVVERMCEGGGEWLRCYQQDPLRCETISGVLVDACVGQEILSKPAALQDKSQIPAVAEGLYACLKTRFMSKYGAEKLQTEECEGVE